MDTSIIDIYKKRIHDKYNDFIKSKVEIDNFKLAKIFEWFSCIKLYEKYNQIFMVYEDIPNDYKEKNEMTRKDTGVDACNMIDTIVQCKLRNHSLTWSDCATFFASQNIFDHNINKSIIKWEKLIISRNSESSLSSTLKFKSKMFIDFVFDTEQIINYCNELLKYPIISKKIPKSNFILRDYQKEAIDLIVNNNKSQK